MIEKDNLKTMDILKRTFEYYGAKHTKGKNWDCIPSLHKTPEGDLSLTEKNGSAVYACHCNIEKGDVFTLISKMENLDLKTDFSKVIEKVCKINNINMSDSVTYKAIQTDSNDQDELFNQTILKESFKIDFTEVYADFLKNDKEVVVKYLESRGINRDLAINSGVMFDRNHNSLVFPVTKNHYVWRSINGNGKGNGTGSIPDIYNKNILSDKSIKEIFITEGIITGLSLERPFVSLNSTSNIKQLKEAITLAGDIAKNKLFVLALDNDKTGRKATTELQRYFKENSINYAQFYFNQKYNDLNDYLQAEPSQLKKDLEIKAYLKPDLVLNYLDQFAKELQENKIKEGISTGFRKLNEHLDGGFYPGLYVIGAISSLGKTTFIQQITDSIAADGNDVLFFSLEMSKFEMVGKSLSRLTFDNLQTRTEAATTRQILKMAVNPEIIKPAVLKYKDIADSLSVIEGGLDTSISDVKSKIENYIELTAKKPVVVIDYLQILQAEKKDAGTDKQKIDYMVTELKRISRDNGITMIVISSFNRDNYMSGVSFESFKESGAIEYTADVVLGLQLQAVNDLHTEKDITKKRDIINKAKDAYPRKIELICLKNRNGKSYFKNEFEFYSKFNYWCEA